MANAQHPRPLAWFEENVPTVAEFVGRIRATIADGKRHILVKAPVKSGKRLMAELLSVVMEGYRTKYVTALNRKDVKSQKAELELYGIHTHLMSEGEKVNLAIADVQLELRNRRKVLVCYDECDYASGTRQLPGRFYEEFIDDIDVVKVYFSATAHETAASNLSTRADYVELTYVPPAAYCGARFFYENGLVFEPDAFFSKEDGRVRVTEHGIQVVRESITANRHIGVVRTTKAIPATLFKNSDVKAALCAQLAAEVRDGKTWDIVAIDDSSPFDWEDRVTRIGYTVDTEINRLFVIMQTCTRGTDLKGWHHRLAFWHDKRDSAKVPLNTMIQALLRPCHYSTDYRGGVFNGPAGAPPTPQPVRLYVDVVVVKVAADDNMEEYLAARGKAPARTKAVRSQLPYSVSPATFDTAQDASEWWASIGRVVGRTWRGPELDEDGTYPWRGERRQILSEEATRASGDLGGGLTSTAHRLIPVRKADGAVGYIVAYRTEADVRVARLLKATRGSMFEARQGEL